MTARLMPNGKPRKSVEAHLLSDSFAPPIVLQTYDGLKVLQGVGSIRTYDFLADVLRPQMDVDVKFSKGDCLFAVPAANFTIVKPHIKRRKAVAEMELRKKPHLARREFLHRLPKRGEITIVLRNGLVMSGFIVTYDRFCLGVRVGGSKEDGGKVVLLWKHGIHAVEGIPAPPITTEAAQARVARDAQIQEMAARGETQVAIAAAVGVTDRTVRRVLKTVSEGAA